MRDRRRKFDYRRPHGAIACCASAKGLVVPVSSSEASIRLERKYPLAIRWMHRVNFSVLFTMVWSGILIYWNDFDNAYQHPRRVYRIGLGHLTLFRFFPEWFYKFLSKSETLRVNGVFGLKMQLKPESYRLQVEGVRDAVRSPFYVHDATAWEYEYGVATLHEDQAHDTKTDPSKMSSIKMAPEGMQEKTERDENHAGRKPCGLEEAGESDSTLPLGTPALLLQLNDFVPQLQRYAVVLQFKCMEGWGQIVQWAGVRFADFIEMFPPALVKGKEPLYVYMETPDGDYYVGYDLHNLRHPQALLVTEMMGEALTQFHGAPLRLYTDTVWLQADRAYRPDRLHQREVVVVSDPAVAGSFLSG